jgi:hypothetical protein
MARLIAKEPHPIRNQQRKLFNSTEEYNSSIKSRQVHTGIMPTLTVLVAIVIMLPAEEED